MSEQPAKKPIRTRTAGANRRRVFACVLLLTSGLVPLHADDVPTAATNTVLRLGFSSRVFAGVNENDAKASAKVWAETILAEHGISISPDLQILDGNETIARAVRDGTIDAITITAEEYSYVGSRLLSTNLSLGVKNGQVTEEYLLLANDESNIRQIADLRGRNLVFLGTGRANLAPVWFETLLLQSGLGETRQFCGRVSVRIKLAEVVLPVFFRQADACVVTRRGFQTMVELNPQVGQQLKILASSPPIVPSLFTFRANYSRAVENDIFTKMPVVESTVAGQQFLTLFQCDSLKVYPVSVLDGTLQLLATHARLIAAANPVTSSSTNVPSALTNAPVAHLAVSSLQTERKSEK